MPVPQHGQLHRRAGGRQRHQHQQAPAQDAGGLWDGKTLAAYAEARRRGAGHRAPAAHGPPGPVRRVGAPAARRLQAQRAVRPLRVVVVDVLGQDGAQVPLVQRDHVVEALPAEGADHPLGDRVGAGRPHRREHRLDAEGLRPLPEVAAVDARPGRG